MKDRLDVADLKMMIVIMDQIVSPRTFWDVIRQLLQKCHVATAVTTTSTMTITITTTTTLTLSLLYNRSTIFGLGP
jgi:hypothetical protein